MEGDNVETISDAPLPTRCASTTVASRESGDTGSTSARSTRGIAVVGRAALGNGRGDTYRVPARNGAPRTGVDSSSSLGSLSRPLGPWTRVRSLFPAPRRRLRTHRSRDPLVAARFPAVIPVRGLIGHSPPTRGPVSQRDFGWTGVGSREMTSIGHVTLRPSSNVTSIIDEFDAVVRTRIKVTSRGAAGG